MRVPALARASIDRRRTSHTTPGISVGCGPCATARDAVGSSLARPCSRSLWSRSWPGSVSLRPSGPHRPYRRRRRRPASRRSITSSSSFRRTARSITTSARSPAPTASRNDGRSPSASPIRHRCARPYHDTLLLRGRRPQPSASVVDVNGGKMDGFVETVRRSGNTCKRHPSDRPCRTTGGPREPARRDGLPHRRGDPELLGVREALRAAGPHVRAVRLVDAARAPVPGLGMGGASARTQDPMSCTSELDTTPGDGRRTKRRPRPYAWTDITYLLHEARRQLGVLRRERTRASSRRARRGSAATRRHESACRASARWQRTISSTTSSRTRTTSSARRTARSRPSRGHAGSGD